MASRTIATDSESMSLVLTTSLVAPRWNDPFNPSHLPRLVHNAVIFTIVSGIANVLMAVAAVAALTLWRTRSIAARRSAVVGPERYRQTWRYLIPYFISVQSRPPARRL